MQLDDKVLVMLTVSEAMQAAHRLGIIHRDLKPGNVMVDRGEDGTLSSLRHGLWPGP